MPQFYARYIPQKVPDSSNSHERKRRGTDEISSDRTSKKSKHDEHSQSNDILNKYSSLKTAHKHHEKVVLTQRKKAKQKYSQPTEAEDEESNEHLDPKRRAILAKFRNATAGAASGNRPVTNGELASTGGHDNDVEAEKHGLEPIPQPAITIRPAPVPLFSSQPEWMRRPVRASRTVSPSFTSLGLKETLAEKLRSQGQRSALPIQTAVIPLLLEANAHHRPDICVSAATGSGKTLSYVLPIVQSLQNRLTTKLRAVIVVPTRTLVRQVAQVCESVLSKGKIRVIIAEGSRSLQEEQRLLVEQVTIYDMQEYHRQQQSQVNWSDFSLQKIIAQAKSKDFIASIGYVTECRSKADLLITTPGRLVEHLQSTEGFNLDNVEWFVVDEADRLLNESFQEWHEVVMPALRSHAATEKRDRLLSSRRIAIPVRRVTKILLSATMTDDLSKLIALDLQDPKLVVIEEETSHESTASTMLLETTGGQASFEKQKFQIPDSLTETAIPLKVNDSGDKPLYLLQLIQSHILGSPRLSKSDGLGDNATSPDENSESSYTDPDSSSSDEPETESSGSSTSSSTAEKDRDEDQLSVVMNGSNSTRTSNVSDILRSRIPRVLVFVRSTESAARLAKLLSLLSPGLEDQISIYTSGANARKSAQKVLGSFRAGKITVLISTDLAGRGLNIEDLEHVVNYDVPTNAQTYIHRVGRTARAGREGHAWTLVEHRQGKWFWEVIGEKGVGDTNIKREGEIKKMNMRVEDMDLKSRYQIALEQLGAAVKGS